MYPKSSIQTTKKDFVIRPAERFKDIEFNFTVRMESRKDDANNQPLRFSLQITDEVMLISRNASVLNK
jgi:hypothetical protein